MHNTELPTGQPDSILPQLHAAIEALAATEHERWTSWQQHLHAKCTRQADGSLVIPAELVSRWERQINTPYDQLSEAEKESDREQVRRYLAVIDTILQSNHALQDRAS